MCRSFGALRRISDDLRRLRSNRTQSIPQASPFPTAEVQASQRVPSTGQNDSQIILQSGAAFVATALHNFARKFQPLLSN